MPPMKTASSLLLFLAPFAIALAVTSDGLSAEAKEDKAETSIRARPGGGPPVDEPLRAREFVGGEREGASDDFGPGRRPGRRGSAGMRARAWGRGHGMGRHAVSEQQIEEGMAFLKTHWSERHSLMERLRVEDPEAFALAYRNIWPQLSRMIELYENRPDLARVEIALVKKEFELLRTVRYYRMAIGRPGRGQDDQTSTTQPEDARAREILNKIRSLVSERFDLQVRRSELRLAELAEQLEIQQQRLEQQRRNKAAEVDQTVQDLISRRFPGRRLRDLRQEGPEGRRRRPEGMRAPRGGKDRMNRNLPPPPPE